ncbi:MAG: DNA repair protein RecN [Victivallales bacterium]|nr:DNA repair protein RecN [Victivallales bacterium]
MLENLHIRNLALVTELDIDFGEGLNTITGETGAGKSLIIGAVQLLAGGRATPASIRKGAKSCEAAGVIRLGKPFDALLKTIDSMLEEAGIPPCEERRLLLRRVITESGSRAYVNGSMVTASFLKTLCDNLIDLHGPHDNQTLLFPNRQMALLDTYAGLLPQVKEVHQLHTELAAVQAEREALKAEGLTPEEADLLEYQLREIDQAELVPEEEEELFQKYKLASNSRHLIEVAAAAAQAISENENSIADQLGTQLRNLRELEQLDPNHGAALVTQLEETVENVRDLGQQIADYAENLDIDQEELQRMENRLDLLQKLKRKYGPTLSDVLETAERIRTRLANIRGRAGKLEELVQKEMELKQLFEKHCGKLSQERRKISPKLAKAIEEKLHNLGFLRAAFAISIKEASPGPNGTDAVEFDFAANVGEEMQPLRQVASSGEIARVMLAIKTVLSDADSIPIMIFDEIDANVGGRVAVTVAQELKAVGQKHQVFSITHLPQIAAAGEQHYLVAKSVADERTTTTMKRLEGEGRLQEIVRMLGADKDSPAALAHAKELLNMK